MTPCLWHLEQTYQKSNFVRESSSSKEGNFTCSFVPKGYTYKSIHRSKIWFKFIFLMQITDWNVKCLLITSGWCCNSWRRVCKLAIASYTAFYTSDLEIQTSNVKIQKLKYIKNCAFWEWGWDSRSIPNPHCYRPLVAGCHPEFLHWKN